MTAAVFGVFTQPGSSAPLDPRVADGRSPFHCGRSMPRARHWQLDPYFRTNPSGGRHGTRRPLDRRPRSRRQPLIHGPIMSVEQPCVPGSLELARRDTGSDSTPAYRCPYRKCHPLARDGESGDVGAQCGLKALVEIEKEAWAGKMQRLLRRACHAANRARERGVPLKPQLIECCERRYDAIVAQVP